MQITIRNKFKIKTTIKNFFSIKLFNLNGCSIYFHERKEIVKRIKYVKPAYEFRDGYGYSNLMFITAGDLIEKITGTSFKQNVTERFLKPLDMDDTVVSVNDFGSNDFGGACPPKGHGPHRYQFTVFALAKPLNVSGNTKSAVVGYMVNANMLAKASIEVTFQRD